MAFSLYREQEKPQRAFFYQFGGNAGFDGYAGSDGDVYFYTYEYSDTYEYTDNDEYSNTYPDADADSDTVNFR